MRIFIVLMLLAGLAHGESYYKCSDKWGNPIFSDKPCEGVNGIEAKVSVLPPPAAGTAFSAEDNAKVALLRKKWGRDKLATEIKKAERAISNYQRSMKNEIASLERKQKRAANNLAGAQYHSSLATQMQAVTQKYSALIQNKREVIKVNQALLND